MEIYKNNVVFPIDYKSKIAFVSLEDSNKSWTLDVDWNFPQNSSKPRMFLAKCGDECEEENEKIGGKPEEKSVHLIAISEVNDLIAFSTNEKSIFVCKIEGNQVTTLSRRTFARTTSSIKFSSCGNILFLADKTGDVFEYSCEDHKAPGKYLFGHISQILDLKVSNSTKYIVTSDRDEKIRISNYPATHDIEAFCLGHLEFVSSIDFIDNDRLVSVSGDKSIKIWSFPDGNQQFSFEFDFVPIIIKVLSRSSTHGSFFLSSNDNSLRIYDYNLSENTLKMQERGKKEYPSDIDMAVHKNDQFYVRFVQEGKVFIENVIVKEKLIIYKNLCDDISSVLLNTNELKATTYKPFEIKFLFKSNKFDGKDEYMDRKKARMEEIKVITKRQRYNHRKNVNSRKNNEDE